MKRGEITIATLCIVALASWLLGVTTRGGIHYREQVSVAVSMGAGQASAEAHSEGGGKLAVQ